jgi:stress-induced morphogen
MGGGTDTMTMTTTLPWEAKRTSETRMVEDLLRQHFAQADSYRYNSASIRVRVIDPRFEGMSREKRDAMVEQHLDNLPAETQRDIVTLFTFAPSELEHTPTKFREYMLNTEFDDPSPSMLWFLGTQQFTKAGIHKMIARLHEELAIYEGSEEARQWRNWKGQGPGMLCRDFRKLQPRPPIARKKCRFMRRY